MTEEKECGTKVAVAPVLVETSALLSQLADIDMSKKLDTIYAIANKVVYSKNSSEKNPGTLYASDGALSWDHMKWLQAEAGKSRVKTQLLRGICDEIKKMTTIFSAEESKEDQEEDDSLCEVSTSSRRSTISKHLGVVENAINESCLSDFILEALQTDSYIAFSKDPALYNAVFNILLLFI